MIKKCNHPDCVHGVMHESIGSITAMRQCNYCVREEAPENWRESKTAKRLKAFIDLNNKKTGVLK